MKTKLLTGLVILATLSLTSCKKDKDKDQEPTTVKIGNRDYAIVKIGTQTWTAENYNGDGGVYYNNDAANAPFGKLYTVAEARAIQVPEGWRLPTLADYRKLFTGQGITFIDDPAEEEGISGAGSWPTMKKLMAPSVWNNEPGQGDYNTSGFSALPAGFGSTTSNFGEKGNRAIFWTSSNGDANDPYYFGIRYNSVEPRYLAYYHAYNDGYKFSIRFVKDN